jgi:CheY-like chemotaxis protein
MPDLTALDVLVVDDHEAMRTLLRKVLERAGVGSVREAAGGAEALEALQEQPAHLILVDQNMPGMGGADFVARVRASGASARIVMITGDARAVAPDGADAVLVKPISPRDLIAALNALLSA